MIWLGIAIGASVASILTVVMMGNMTAAKVNDLYDEIDRLRSGTDAQ